MWTCLLQRVHPELYSETAQVPHLPQEVDYETVPRVVCLAVVMFSYLILSPAGLAWSEAKHSTVPSIRVVQDDALICAHLSLR